MKDKIKAFFKDKNNLNYIIIFLVTLFCCIPLCSKYMDISTDDGIQHFYRLVGTHASLKEGNLFSVIMSGFCNGFGYSWNIFYSPLTAYLPLVFMIFTSSYVLCLKLFMAFCIFLSGIFMYKLVYKISNSTTASIISALVYITAPYHLTDLYNRIAVAELASFVFIPIVFIGMYDLLRSNKKNYYIAIGAIGLALTHNVITIYTAIFCFIYLLANYKKLNDKRLIKNALIIITIILLTTSFYWIPLLEHYFATTYEVFIPGRMFNTSTITESKLFLRDLIYSKKWGINLYIGLPIIFGTILTFLYRRNIKDTYKKDLTIFLIFGVLSLIMTLKIFPFEYLPSILRMLQFVWRMLIFASFFLSIVSGITIAMFINEKAKRRIVCAIIFMIYIVILVNSTKQMTKIAFKEERFVNPIPVNSQTLKVHAGCATFEYLPQKAFSNLEYIKTRNPNAIVLDGTANIINENKNGTKMTLEIEGITSNVTIELPYIYYLGYYATLTDESGNIIELQIKESDNGFCMIDISNTEKGVINISYKGTTLMKASYALTLAGLMCLIIYIRKLTKVT